MRRNAELHTGEDAFAGIGTSEWLPYFYMSCKVLLEFIGKELKDLFDDPKGAESLIASLQDAAAKAVWGEIDSHSKIWAAKNKEDQQMLFSQATSWATRMAGHRTKCPACGCPALEVLLTAMFLPKSARMQLCRNRRCWRPSSNV